ncbi:MAG TPA: ATP-binding protein [Polyangiaceae bacterium]|nr:ATP-binding protein [Polyangiaceae bacterium]
MSTPTPAVPLALLLRDHRDRIVARFVAEVQRKDLSPPGTSRSLLVNHIPGFLDEMVQELASATPVRMSQDSIDTSQTARQHGEQRWGLGYDLEALIREYGVLRHCILLTAKEAGAELSVDEFDVLAKCLNVGVAQAATAYIGYRDEQLDARNAQLEFLAEAGQLLSSSLDYRSTLSRLTGLLVPRLADWCAVHLEDQGPDEMPIMHVDAAKAGTLRTIYRKHPFLRDSLRGFADVVRTGVPSLVSVVAPDFWETVVDDPEQRGLLRAIGTVSWIIVPLRVQGHVFGAMTLAHSDSGRHYGESDLALANEIARRAAVAIDNARLYDLSQDERSRVEAATRAKDEFVAMVSHELRTPLNSILGWLRLVRDGTLPEPRREHAIEVSVRNAQALNQLVGDLLDISRAITGKIRITPSQVDLNNVVEMAIEAVRPAAAAKRLQLDLVIDDTDAVMRGDGDRLQQVAWNLLANAVKFTPKNGFVRVRVARVASDLQLTVEDSGAGITADFLPHVFEGFRQSETGGSRAHGGLGIGLSIARHIVDLHGGSIEARSPGPGKGATFVVRLPISPLVSTTLGVSRVPATTKAPAAAVALPAGLVGIRVLVVDDEPDARELVAYVLERSGMEVRAAGSAAGALKELETYTPHVIVSDIGMPDEDGYSLIRRVRTLAADDKKRIPAIALTAFARNEDRKRALVEGFNLHMVKPVEPAALVKAVADLAGQARPAQV